MAQLAWPARCLGYTSFPLAEQERNEAQGSCFKQIIPLGISHKDNIFRCSSDKAPRESVSLMRVVPNPDLPRTMLDTW